jgi:diguanylate cyclase (GGDEF)-like protein
MISMKALRALFSIPIDNPALMHSQLKAYSRQLPLLYFILISNTIALAYTHYGIAPFGLTIVFPVCMTAIFLVRVWTWARRRDEILSDEAAARGLSRSVILGAVLGVVLFGWGAALYGYGDAYAQSHVVFAIAIMVIGCIFCLIHLRAAAFLLTITAVIPFAIFLIATGRPVFIAIALDILPVSAAMTYVMFLYSRDFANMIDFQKELVETHLETKRLNDENSQLANLDTLTDLPNRRQFFTTLQEVLQRADARGQRFVVGLVDLDGFKSVNDLYGHSAGDKVLIESGRRMQAQCGDAVFLARLGGDEFGVIIDAAMSDPDIRALGERLCDSLEASFTLPGVIAQISSSVGFATFPEAGASVELLFERADYALYHAKQHQRGRPVIFSAEHESEISQFGKLEQCLRHADLEAEMSLHFQPVFDVERGKVVAFEALARWDSRKLGRVAPDIFVRVAERSDLIHKLTQTLLRKALACAKTWPHDMRISFNLSVRDLTSYEAILAIIAIIENSGVASHRIDLEVTETAFMRDFEQARKSLQTLKALGVGISLDDFGIGYSSLSYVHRLPIDKIKIDRSFVKDVATEATCGAVVKTVIDLCRNLKLTCVAEGMETDEQARILRELGCTTMQGYLFGRPMPAREVVDFVNGTAGGPPRLAAAS